MYYSPFEYYPVSEETATRLKDIAILYGQFAKDIEAVGGDRVPRLQALAKTALEESAMWYSKALAHANKVDPTSQK